MENTKATTDKTSASTLSKEDDDFKSLLSTLPEQENWNKAPLYLYKGFWYPFLVIRAVLSFQKSFHAHDTDIILASLPKSGTNWLMAIIYMIANRNHFPLLNESPLLTSNPQDLVRFLELDLYLKTQCPDLETIPEPRIFATHTPYSFLPTSINESNCKIVYLCRNPLDQFISLWHFLGKVRKENVDPLSLEESFEMYCKGIHSFGPFWNHVVEYWKASQENPDKLLFLKYEELKQDTIGSIERIAEFLGFPFSKEEEEEEGVVKEISRICSFQNLKNLDVNKNGKRPGGAPNNAFFRKGEVGDWANHLTPSMAERFNKLVQEKLEGSGLQFDLPFQVQKQI